MARDPEDVEEEPMHLSLSLRQWIIMFLVLYFGATGSLFALIELGPCGGAEEESQCTAIVVSMLSPLAQDTIELAEGELFWINVTVDGSDEGGDCGDVSVTILCDGALITGSRSGPIALVDAVEEGAESLREGIPEIAVVGKQGIYVYSRVLGEMKRVWYHSDGDERNSVWIGDADDDGMSEMLVGARVESGNMLEVWENDTEGALCWERVWVSEPGRPGAGLGVVSGDVDHDGKEDNIVACDGRQLTVWKYAGDDVWEEVFTQDLGAECWDLDVGDLDDDGCLEIVTSEARGGTGRLHVWKFSSLTDTYEHVCTSEETFGGPGAEVGRFIDTVVVCDADNDGRDDNVVTCGNQFLVTVWKHSDSNLVIIDEIELGEEVFAQGCGCDDIDGDGKNEVFFGDIDGLWYIYGEESGEFDLECQASTGCGSSMTKIPAADLDGDGLKEMITQSCELVVWGKSDGYGYQAAYTDENGFMSEVAAGNLDHDRRNPRNPVILGNLTGGELRRVGWLLEAVAGSRGFRRIEIRSQSLSHTDATAGLMGLDLEILPAVEPANTTLRVLWSVNLTEYNLYEASGSPKVSDLDGDGRNEVLLGYRRAEVAPWSPEEEGQGENRLVCLTDRGEISWVFPPLGEPDLPFEINFLGWPDAISTPTIVDLDGDGRLEVLIGRRGGALHCISCDGEELWNFSRHGALGEVIVEYELWGEPMALVLDRCLGSVDTPQVYDCDGDGNLEIYVPSGAPEMEYDIMWGRITVLDAGGEMLWNVDLDGKPGPPIVCDINQDGSAEIVAALNSNDVVCLRGDTGDLIWKTNLPGNGWHLESTPVAADVDRDGRYEILTGSNDGNFYVIDEDGKVEWNFTTGLSEGKVQMCYPVGDIDGDSNLEVSFTDDHYVYCLDLYTRKQEWLFEPEWPDDSNNFNLFADVTGDGDVDVLVASPILYILNSEGQLQASFDTPNIHHDYWAQSGIWVGDLMGDGRTEIITKMVGDSVYCLTMDGRYDPSNMPWPEFFGNAMNRPVIPLE